MVQIQSIATVGGSAMQGLGGSLQGHAYVQNIQQHNAPLGQMRSFIEKNPEAVRRLLTKNPERSDILPMNVAKKTPVLLHALKELLLDPSRDMFRLNLAGGLIELGDQRIRIWMVARNIAERGDFTVLLPALREHQSKVDAVVSLVAQYKEVHRKRRVAVETAYGAAAEELSGCPTSGKILLEKLKKADAEVQKQEDAYETDVLAKALAVAKSVKLGVSSLVAAITDAEKPLTSPGGVKDKFDAITIEYEDFLYGALENDWRINAKEDVISTAIELSQACKTCSAVPDVSDGGPIAAAINELKKVRPAFVNDAGQHLRQVESTWNQIVDAIRDLYGSPRLEKKLKVLIDGKIAAFEGFQKRFDDFAAHAKVASEAYTAAVNGEVEKLKEKGTCKNETEKKELIDGLNQAGSTEKTFNMDFARLYGEFLANALSDLISVKEYLRKEPVDVEVLRERALAKLNPFAAALQTYEASGEQFLSEKHYVEGLYTNAKLLKDFSCKKKHDDDDDDDANASTLTRVAALFTAMATVITQH